ncbi:RNA polymerase sigma factor [Xanthomonas vesicatoria]|uniref:RNA polymerase sigma factor n=1 Tax=Xanthomonas vesicatoria TaxID=56460 RepID=UPI0007323B6A|nr:sigma-70 family RNA polymerase sigma factor [Xanthomonas vesicatoria]KTF38900.1 RNA polymerase sigma24 factor [Xanthomonas vesicatoria]MCC8557036.1 sigma-70 family RNA polymerase sigma factor [Xanthomonas vesicatoria]MCC8599910.1 sigma-70 family RNA polymerase sigma factor [Xanthomonas vesicatoria]MCC8609183.1 sigma-70 family RNA polymerase sigma factor [Xanthomonas vesicatoria]MCC8675551.1 sigma-70 family RNA polymerase sigma factor [Xanthomonas vesicatoria]
MLDTSVPIDVLPCATPADRDDAALARAAAAGERAAYEAIYRRHSPRLYALVWRLCGGNAARADDVLQDTFIAAWKALPQFRFQSALGTWLHRLAVNTALMELRARAAFGDHSSDDSEAMLAAVPDGAGCHSIRMDLERALETLPPRARAVLVLHDIEGWKHQEIAEQLQMAVGSSKAQLHRARGLLRARLGEHA